MEQLRSEDRNHSNPSSLRLVRLSVILDATLLKTKFMRPYKIFHGDPSPT